MATALDLMARAARSLGIIESGEVLSHEEAQDMLVLLQDMLEGWSTEHFAIPVVTTDDLPLTIGQANYTYGPGGDLDETRPQSIIGCYLRDLSGYDYPVRITYRERYNAVPDKGLPSRPCKLYWVPDYPQMSLFFDNSPDIPYTARIDALKPLDTPSAITDDVVFPPGYDRAIRYNLAIEAAPEYGVNVPQVVASLADRSLSNLKRQNLRIPVLKTEIADRGRYNIYTDY